MARSNRPARRWRSVTLAVVAAGCAVLMTGGTAVAAAPSADPGISVPTNPEAADVSAVFMSALKRDLNLTVEQARTRLVRADWASRLDVPLRQRLGRAYAGSWLADDGQQFVVAMTDRRWEPLVRASGATPRLVTRSLTELSAIGAKLDRWTNGSGHVPAGVAAWVVDPQLNQVRVHVFPGGQPEAEAFVTGAGVARSDVAFVPANPQERITTTSDVKGGAGILVVSVSGDSGICSAGFAVIDRDNRPGFLTAAHCDATRVYRYPAQPCSVIDANCNYIGDFAGPFRDGGDHDETYVLTRSSWRPVPTVNNPSGPDIPVDDGVEQVAGSPVCRSGITTGLRCGTIKAGFWSGAPGYTNMRAADTCVSGGDSGGAVIAPSGSGNHAQGIVHGGNGFAFLCLRISRLLQLTYYVPLQRALSALNLRLQTASHAPTPTPTPSPTPSPKWTGGKKFWGGLGGSVIGKVSPVSLIPSSVQIFGRGTDNGLYTNRQTDGVWSGWQGLGEVVTEPPTAVARNGGIDVYFRGGDTRPYFKRFNGTSWQPAVKLGDIGVQGTIEAVSSGPNTVHLFIRGSDNELKLNLFNGTQWSGWLGLGGEVNAWPPSALVYKGASGQEVVDVFVRWSDDSIRYRRSDPNTQPGFQNWVNLGGAWSQPPVAVNIGPNHNMVFAVHRGDKTLHVQRWNNNDWLRGTNGDIKFGWRGLGGNVQSIPTAIAGPGNQVRVFTRDSNQRVNMATWLGNEFFWENWVPLDGDTVAPVGANRRMTAGGGGIADAFGVDAATLQPFHTTVDIAAPTVTVMLNSTAFTVGDGATYTVTGPPGAPIYWSSTKNGVSTGENYAFYGHYLDDAGTFTAYAGEWGGSTVGSWVKYVHVGSQTLQTAQVAFTVSHRPVAVYVDQPSYQIGVETVTYAVTGPANQPIYWSSWRNGVPTGEDSSFYGHYTNADGVFTATVGAWTPGTEGHWIKQINIGGVLRQVEFDVFP